MGKSVIKLTRALTHSTIKRIFSRAENKMVVTQRQKRDSKTPASWKELLKSLVRESLGEGRSTILVFIILLPPFFSCNRQNPTAQTNGNSTRINSSVAIGDKVKGLSDSIMVIYQDKKNIYWFGSRGQGVFKYDGKNMLRFTMKDGLVSNDIWGIQEDKSGNIYFDTQEGVSKFDGQTFSTLQESNFSNNDWAAASPDELWFKGNWNKNGAYRYDGEVLYHLEFPKNKLADQLFANSPNMTWSPYGIYSSYKDKTGNTWFGTSNVGIYRCQLQLAYSSRMESNLGWMYEDQLTSVPGGGSFGIRSIFEDKYGKFWFCNTRFRYTIEADDSIADGQRFIRYKREKGIGNFKSAEGKDHIYFLSITEDNNQDLWMVTYNEGVWHYDWKKMTQYPVKDGTKVITLFSIYKDNVGNLWLGTHESGAYKFNGKTFERFRP
jgi:ligand-binding sensor domain-containing protein